MASCNVCVSVCLSTPGLGLINNIKLICKAVYKSVPLTLFSLLSVISLSGDLSWCGHIQSLCSEYWPFPCSHRPGAPSDAKGGTLSVHPVQAVCHLGGLHGAGRPRAASVAAPPGNCQLANASHWPAAEPASKLTNGCLQSPNRHV